MIESISKYGGRGLVGNCRLTPFLVRSQISGDKTLLNLAAPHRQFLSQCNVTTVEDFGRPQSKQTCKNRTLFLFNDLLVVTKAHKGANYNLKQVIPLLGIGVRAVVSLGRGAAGEVEV
jgi:hypothetical protein